MATINSECCLKELLEAEEHIWSHTFNFITSTALNCALDLGIPDIIFNQGRPLTLSELVTQLSIQDAKSAHLYRLMRILVHTGFFNLQKENQDDQEGYVLTSSSRLLLKCEKTSLSPFVQMSLDPVFVSPCLFTSSWFKGAESASSFETLHGTSLYNYIGKNPDASRRFNAAMASKSELATRVLVRDCKHMFEGFGSLVDVAGGTGTVAKAISEAFPRLKCTVYDLPHVISSINQSSKCNLLLVAGDMFESVPSADIVLIKNVLQDWSDEECVKILKHCKDAITQKDNRGKVMIFEIVIDENKGKAETIKMQLCYDVFKMALVAPGKERTEIEWEKLFQEAGFTSYKITPVLSMRSIIEVFP